MNMCNISKVLKSAVLITLLFVAKIYSSFALGQDVSNNAYIVLELENKAFNETSQTIYINCDADNNCDDIQNQLAISITNNCDFSIIIDSLELSLFGIDLQNLGKISTDNDDFSVSASDSSGKVFKPVITIIPKKHISLSSHETCRINLTHIDCPPTSTGGRHYNLVFNYNDGQSTNIRSSFNIAYPPDPQKHNLSETVKYHFTNGGGRSGSPNVVYNSDDGYNANIPNTLTFYLMNSDPHNTLNCTPLSSNFVISFVTSDNIYSYGALMRRDKMPSVTHDPTSFGSWSITYDEGSWTLTPACLNNDPILGVHDNATATFIVSNILANFENGMTPMYIGYSSIPDYNDGSFMLPIEKDTAPPTIVSFGSDKQAYSFGDTNSCPGVIIAKISSSDQEIIFNYYLYGTSEWSLKIYPISESPSESITVLINVNSSLSQKSFASLKLSDIAKLTGTLYNKYEAQLSTINSTVSEPINFSIFMLSCHQVTGSFLKWFYSIGDVNHDGISDFIVGTEADDVYNDKAYVIYGQKDASQFPKDLGAMNNNQGFTITGPKGFEGALSGIGDLNQDGICDFMLCAGVGDRDASRWVAVVYGQKDGSQFPINVSTMTSTQGFTITGSEWFGSSVGGIKDINGDDINDFVVGASGDSMSYVIYGQKDSSNFPTNADNMSSNQGFKITGQIGFGGAVSGIGDVNGDHINDFIVGAFDLENAVYVIYGQKNAYNFPINADSMSSNQGFKITMQQSIIEAFRAPMSGIIGDVTGDGVNDFIVSDTQGTAYIIYGQKNAYNFPTNVDSMNSTQGVKITGPGSFGSSVRGIGDVNGDDINDFIVGGDQMAAYVIYGQKNGSQFPINVSTMTSTQGFTITGSEQFGSLVGGMEDINCDRISDFIVANGLANFYIFYGPTRGRGHELTKDSTSTLHDEF